MDGYVQSTSIVQTVPLCPSYVPSRSPLSENQTLMTWSFEQENSRSPSLLNLICVSERSWPVQTKSRVRKIETETRHASGWRYSAANLGEELVSGRGQVCEMDELESSKGGLTMVNEELRRCCGQGLEVYCLLCQHNLTAKSIL